MCMPNRELIMRELTKKQIVKRVILWMIAALVIFIIGIVVGYVTIGHGQWNDLIQPSTWKHVFRLVNG